MASADARQRNLVGNGGKLVAGVEDDGTWYGATQRVGENLHSVGSMQEDEVQVGRETLERTMALIVTGLIEEALEKPNRNNMPINQSHVGIYGEGERPTRESTSLNSQLIVSDQVEGVISPNQGSRRWKRQARGQGSTSVEGGLRPGIKRPVETKEIEDGDGRVLCSKEEVATGFRLHFNQVYQSANPTERAIQQCLNGVRHRISRYKREQMDREFTSEEVVATFKQMSPFKSPGPDGFSAGFFQDHWDIVGSDVVQAVLDFFRTGEMPTGLNHTLIALIPKTSAPRSVNEYRPISLCNVWYKLISKVLANRLKPVLQDVISWNQSAFLSGRLITDNIMVAYELLHTMQARQKEREGNMAIKLDMSRAYDRVEWGFLQTMLSKLGFSDKWRKLVMACVKSVFYSVVVNGTPGDIIWPTRGLRQGDPLSPYLFLLCVEGLSTLLKEAEARGKEVMIKSVLQAIPAYTMSVFKMPSMLLKEIESMIAKFWWNHRKEGRGIHWKSWNKLGAAKGKGGLGFRDLNCFNRALLAKQGWRILQEPTSLVAQVFKEKYFKSGNLMEARVGYCPSQNLEEPNDSDGSGKDWIQSPNKILDCNAIVSELIDGESKTWKQELVQAIFSQEEAKSICSIPISVKGMGNKVIWGLSEKGIFSIKSAYYAYLETKNQKIGETSSGDQNERLWRRVWRLTNSGKVKQFLWKALNGILPTRSILFKRRIIDNSTCPVCNREEETDIHVLWDCPALVDVWGEDCNPVRK
ncbi:uncharacterized protein LOC122274622 [Carya illinoinensis]|uniref:uncharacterized protein LOC122274622 n=1 Tax=Carya illinoinensis TaxID=32201 RepID=UPI001C724240|nr:uncharacterized protein LOC122274622 [Carya illinoinensis]